MRPRIYSRLITPGVIVLLMTFLAATAKPFTAAAASTNPSQRSSTNIILQTCSAYGDTSQTVTCTLPEPVRAGDVILLEVPDVPAVTVSDSMGNTFTQVASVGLYASTYDLRVYSAVPSTGGYDRITLSGGGNYPSLVVHELSHVQLNGQYSTGSGHGKIAGVSAYTPGAHVSVLAVVNIVSPTGTTFRAGTGYSLIGVYSSSVPITADEVGTPSGTTVSHFRLGQNQDWAEISLAFT